MALKHYGSRTPPAPTEWTCPSCGAENSVPIAAGCQSCRAGADAKKVVGALPQAEAAARTPLPSLHREVGTAAMRPEYLGFDVWRAAHPVAKDLLEAFMAGVAWAEAQVPKFTGFKTAEEHARVAQPESTVPASWERPGQFLSIGSDVHDMVALDDPASATIIAALAFYRDSVLIYDAMPGQLDAQGVTDLLARLVPQELPA